MTERKRLMVSFISLAILVLTIVLTALLLITEPRFLTGEAGYQLLDLPILALGILVSMASSSMLVMSLFIQFVQKLYDLSPEDASAFVGRVIVGLPARPPLGPIWRIEKGRADPDGPAVLRKIGGPGFLSIGHDSAVMTSRVGSLHRVLGPGFHGLHAFEKVWDVVDLRPQRRTLTAGAMTRDDIPVYCKASIRFRIDSGGIAATEHVPFPFSEDAILKTTAGIKRHKAGGVIQNWTQRITGSLEGSIRDRLEQYKLDDFLASDQYQEPLIQKLEKEIIEEVKADGLSKGIKVEEIQVSPVLPSEDAISRQWMETWQSEWQRYAAIDIAEGEALQKALIEVEQVKAQVDLISRMLAGVEQMNADGHEINPQLVMLRFLDVIRAMAEREPLIRHLMFEQAESLRRILYSFQTDQNDWPAAEAPGKQPGETKHALPA